MLTERFPLYGLRVTTPRLELRLPGLEELAALADTAAEGIHDPAFMPFEVAWSLLPPDERALSVVQHHFRLLAQLTPNAWNIPFVIFRDGVPIGQQNVTGREVALTREVTSGSWLGQRYHGQGYGTEMRAAVLHLAFEGLGLDRARSAAHSDNGPSLGVSRKLGYVEDGTEWTAVLGKRRETRRLVLTRENWERHRTVPVEVEGLAACLPMLGLAAPAVPATTATEKE